MTGSVLTVVKAGPALTIQDLGRPGYQRYGVAEGGAVDLRAMAEGAALLGNGREQAAIEMFGFGGTFITEAEPVRIAVTGARMKAELDGKTLEWRSSFLLEPGKQLSIGAATDGNYGYLHVGGGIGSKPVLRSRSTHSRARLGGLDGRPLRAGDRVPLLEDPGTATGMSFERPLPKRLDRVRILWGAQAHWFSDEERERFLETIFTVTPKLDRMGIRLANDGAPIHSALGLSGLSDAVSLGDVQIPGDGQPAVLLADRQPTGGYPRIATIITADLADMVQRPPGSSVRFQIVTEEAAIEALRAWRRDLETLGKTITPLLRDPRDISNLLEYNLISGVVSSRNANGKEDCP